MNTILIRKKWLIIFLMFILFVVIGIPSPSLWAGQLISPEVKEWAREKVKEEVLPPSPNTLAVLYFVNKTGRKELDPIQKGIALMLITDLSKVKGIQIVERIKLQALLDEKKIGVSGLADPATVSDMSRLLGAEWIIGGDILEGQPPAFQISSNFLDVPKQEILGQKVAEGILSELFTMEKKILFDIIDILAIEITPSLREELQKPITKNISALLLWCQGIDASDNGNYYESAAFYQNALTIDPSMGIAKDSLEELNNTFFKSIDFLKDIRDNTSLNKPEKDITDPGINSFNPMIIRHPAPKWEYWVIETAN